MRHDAISAKARGAASIAAMSRASLAPSGSAARPAPNSFSPSVTPSSRASATLSRSAARHDKARSRSRHLLRIRFAQPNSRVRHLHADSGNDRIEAKRREASDIDQDRHRDRAQRDRHELPRQREPPADRPSTTSRSSVDRNVRQGRAAASDDEGRAAVERSGSTSSVRREARFPARDDQRFEPRDFRAET